MLLDSSRHVLVYLAALLASGVGSLAFVTARAARTLAHVLPSVYDVYVSVPLRIERALKSAREAGAKPAGRRPRAKLELREETLS
jgi:hypothetical protein